jgi:hypothetical protein
MRPRYRRPGRPWGRRAGNMTVDNDARQPMLPCAETAHEWSFVLYHIVNQSDDQARRRRERGNIRPIWKREIFQRAQMLC